MGLFTRDAAHAAPATCASSFATGGTITSLTDSGDEYCIHQFTGGGTFTALQGLTAEYLIVGGGGGGGAYAGGGGGAGGLVMGNTSIAANAYVVVVGAGGTGDARSTWPPLPVPGGGNGQSSSAFGITALGGGGGGTYNNSTLVGNGQDGGSGGGASHQGSGGTGTFGQGSNGAGGTINSGDSSGGGGGGAGQGGFSGTYSIAGHGGDGVQSDITGSLVYYGGGGAGGGDVRGNRVATNLGGAGGGGASRNDGVASDNGLDGYGGGGGGGHVNGINDSSTGGNGGSGVVIIRYLANSPPGADAGPSQTVNPFSSVTLDGTGSTDPENNITGYLWEQVSGETVAIGSATSATANFTAPVTGGTLTFNLTVTDKHGLTSTSQITITVRAPGVTVTALSGQPSEAGDAASFTVVLNSEPTADVTIAVSSSDSSEGSVSPATLRFTPGDWSTPQSVTVTGVDDNLADGTPSYSIVLAAAVSLDLAYDGFDPADVPSVTTTDDDTPGVTVTALSGQPSETGDTASFTVVLNSEPTADVTIAVSSSDSSEGSVSPATLRFTPGDWSTPQSVTVTGVDDNLADGTPSYSIVLAAAVSLDLAYDGFDPADVTPVTTTDDDTPGVTVTALSGQPSEAGDAASFTVVLNSEPTADVTIAVSSSDSSEGSVSPATLSFTPGDWSTPQSVTVTGVDDNLADGTPSYSIVLAAAVSLDLAYDGFDPADVTPVTTTDDDTPGVVVSVAALSVAEDGGTGGFTVRLNSEPTGDVIIDVVSLATGVATVTPAILSFMPGNWSDPQTVTVMGVNDDVDNNTDLTATIALTMNAATVDSAYLSADPADVLVTVTDDLVDGATIVSDLSSLLADGVSSAVLTVTLTNNSGGAASGETVVIETTAGTISSVTDNGDGTYSATLTSSTTIEVAGLSFTIGGAPALSTVEVAFTTAVFDKIVVSSDVDPLEVKAADGEDAAEITVRVFDNGVQVPTGGLTFWASTDLGELGQNPSSSTVVMQDNKNGSYTSVLTAQSVGSATVRVTTNDVNGTEVGRISVTFAQTAVDNVVKETQEQIAGFMLGRANNLASSQPGLTRFLMRNDCRHFYGTFTLESGSVSSCTSQGSSWAEFTSMWSDTGSYTLGSLGFHEFITPDLLVGGVFQFDYAEDDTHNASGHGWMLGPYFVSKVPDQPLYFEGRLLFGRTKNEITPFGFYTDSFKTERWLAQLRATGQYQVRQTTLMPLLDFTYTGDRQVAYTDGLGNTIPAQTVDLMQLNLGLDFSRPIKTRVGALTLTGGISGIYSASDGAAVIPGLENWHGRTHLGLEYNLPPDSTLNLGIFYDDLGLGNEAFGATFNAAIRF
ncbi:glycine-rich domain-containing protein [Pseudophaeobacter arcticus]|uniref:invasin domain 3-containing protein n=1 Tax=Pseudophaeobacter arcticus TaxID=385492 RepID=UPI003610679C